MIIENILRTKYLNCSVYRFTFSTKSYPLEFAWLLCTINILNENYQNISPQFRRLNVNSK